MLFILSILCYVLLVIGILVLLIIVIPYEYSAFGKKSEECYVRGSFSWLFGGIKLGIYKAWPGPMEASITILGIKKKIEIRKKAMTLKEEKHRKRKRLSTKKYLNIDLIKKVLSAALKILAHCKPRKFYINARAGFEDPSYTGLICAVRGLANQFLEKYHIRIQPVFDEELIEGRFLIRGRIWLPYLILVVVGILITKPFRYILISNIKVKIKGGI